MATRSRWRPFGKQNEFTRCSRNDVPNNCQFAALRLLCLLVLQSIRDPHVPVSVTSGFRSAEVNAHPKVGGDPNSQHLRGEAADIEFPGLDNREFFEWIQAEPLPYDQLILEFREGVPDSGWIHVSHAQAQALTTLATSRS